MLIGCVYKEQIYAIRRIMKPTPRTRFLKLIVAKMLGLVHTPLSKTKQKQNRHNIEATGHTHFRRNADIF